jgi:putative pyruvate formate lyase activating enzyme
MKCLLCPRKCGADRTRIFGFCSSGLDLRVAAVIVHRGEEPPLIAGAGSGAIFFSGCPLKCSYCQNLQISHEALGCMLTPERLAVYLLELQKMGCSNINLVTPTHYAERLLLSLEIAKDSGLSIPIILNSSGYENIDTLKMLLPYIDIFLMDIRYGDNLSGQTIGGVKDYWDIARDAVEFLHREKGVLKTDEYGGAVSGLIVRHLVLPGMLSNPYPVLEFLACISHKIPVSILSQYNPAFYKGNVTEMHRRVTEDEYKKVVGRAVELGFGTVFTQDTDSCDSYFPDFSRLQPFEDGINLLLRDGCRLEKPYIHPS